MIDTTRASERVYRGLTGDDRAMLYLVAFSTGYRAGELAALTPEGADLDAAVPTWSLPGRLTKNRRRVGQPLPPGVVHQLHDFLPRKPAGKPVWPGTWIEKPVKMLCRDLKDAKVAYRIESIDGPKYADFHALRHSYLSALAAAGVGVKELQELARHSDPRITLGIYTHARPGALVDSVGRLPLPGAASSNPLAKLGRGELEGAVVTLAVVVRILTGAVDTRRDTPTMGAEQEDLGLSGTRPAQNGALRERENRLGK